MIPCQEGRKKILILHGWASFTNSWAGVKEILEGYGYQVFYPCLPGFGETAAPAKPWTVDDYIFWVKDFSGKNNLDRFFLLGYSFGGRLAIKFSARYPEKLRGLILCAPAGITFRPKAGIFFFSLIAKIGKIVFSLPLISFCRNWARKLIYWLVKTQDYYRLDNEIMKETFKKVIAEDLTPCLEKIQTPTLIIAGVKDRVIPLADSKKMNRKIKGSILKIILAGRHNFYRQFPERTAKEIRFFIESQGVQKDAS